MRLAASTVATPAGLLRPGAVEVADGRIVAVGPPDPGEAVPDRVLAPGFVDLQVNGHGDVDVARADGADWDRLDALLLAQGVTTWCPTLVTAPLDAYAAPLARIAAAAAARRPGGGAPRPAIAGAHLEGPFLGGAPGAHRPELIVPPDLDWLGSLPPVVRMVTLAPEAPAAAEAVRLLAGRGVLVALGHSTATHHQALAAARAGARLVTHLFNGMGPFHHRSPGLVGAALADDGLAVSVIADGVHLDPLAVRLAFRAKGPGRVVLVTDAVAVGGGGTAGLDVAVVDGAARLADGRLAGSTLTMDAAVRHAVVAAGVPLAEAVAAASATPAALLGLVDRGRLEPGRRADLVALSPDLAVEQVWVAGVATQ